MRFLLILLILSLVYPLDITLYYGEGCPHCARTMALFDELKDDYNLSITTLEVYHNPSNRELLFREYERRGMNPLKGGVPTTIVNDRTMVIGELPEDEWRLLFDTCESDGCPDDILTHGNIDVLKEKNPEAQLTLPVLVGAALADSVNPCTIAVMAMLLAVIMATEGRKKVLIAGLAFSLTIYIMYLLMGLGILKAITSLSITGAFYLVVTILAFILAILELKAYVDYKPGGLSVEMPMFLRPYARACIEKATSIPGVVLAAVFCSLFLLPCSSGPYLIVLGMISKAVTLKALSYLLIYNAIFILPLLIVTTLVFFGRATAEQVQDVRNKYVREMHLVAGILLMIIFFLMLNTYEEAILAFLAHLQNIL